MLLSKRIGSKSAWLLGSSNSVAFECRFDAMPPFLCHAALSAAAHVSASPLRKVWLLVRQACAPRQVQIRMPLVYLTKPAINAYSARMDKKTGKSNSENQFQSLKDTKNQFVNLARFIIVRCRPGRRRRGGGGGGRRRRGPERRAFAARAHGGAARLAPQRGRRAGAGGAQQARPPQLSAACDGATKRDTRNGGSWEREELPCLLTAAS
jgi:hypothetical protein